MMMKISYVLLGILAYLTMACSNKYIISPSQIKDLKSGEKIEIVTVNQATFHDRFISQNIDTIMCEEKSYRKEDVVKIEVKKLSFGKTAGLISAIGIGIIPVTYLVIIIGVATGLVPFDN